MKTNKHLRHSAPHNRFLKNIKTVPVQTLQEVSEHGVTMEKEFLLFEKREPTLLTRG